MSVSTSLSELAESSRSAAREAAAVTARVEHATPAEPFQLRIPLDATASADRSSAAGGPRKKRKVLRALLMLGGTAVVILASGAFWLHGGRWVSADNAYVRAAKLMVSTDVSGLVASVEVKQGQKVKAGDILFRVDPEQFRIALDAAEANLALTALNLESQKEDYLRLREDVAAQEAQVALAQATYDRSAVLVRSDYTSKASYDQANFGLTVAQKRLQSLRQQAKVALTRLGGNPDLAVTKHPLYLQARSQADEARRQLEHTVVRAPFDGIATQVDALQPGTYLVAQTAVLTNTGAIGLISSDQIWIDANLKETDLTHIKPGDQVNISVDTYPGYVFKGHIDTIAPSTGSEFSILPAQNSSGNWVKVVQRISVIIRVDPDPDSPILRSGMSAVVDIDTGHERKLSDLWDSGSKPVTTQEASHDATKG
jgi:membrane fusion protein (multidrug efflux system)